MSVDVTHVTTPSYHVTDDVYTEYFDLSQYNVTNTGMYDFYAVPQLAFVSILCAFIVGGNVCVLVAIRLSEIGRKSRMNFFILHLAISDLLVGVLVSLADLLTKITVEWHAGNVMCKLLMFLQATVTYSSTYMLVSLSIDRYYAVARPMSFSRSGSQAKILVATAWAASVLLASPYLFLYNEKTWAGKSQCWIDFNTYWHWQLFFTINAVATFFVPTLIIASCYIAIIHIIWSKGRRKCHSRIRYNWLGQRAGSTYGPDHQMTISESRHDSSQGIIPQAKIRTVKMTLIIVIVFILCWSPYFLYNLLDLYGQIPVNDPLTTFIQSAAPLNSAANPIIYGIFSTRICKNLRRLPVHPTIRRTFCCCADSTSGDRHYHSNHQARSHHNHHHNHYYHPHYNHTHYNHNDLTTCTSNGGRGGGGGRLLYNHGHHHPAKPKHGSLVVTVNKKGYSPSSKLTQFDSIVLNIESSTTTNSSDTQLEMNSIIKSTSDNSSNSNNKRGGGRAGSGYTSPLPHAQDEVVSSSTEGVEVAGYCDHDYLSEISAEISPSPNRITQDRAGQEIDTAGIQPCGFAQRSSSSSLKTRRGKNDQI